MVCNYCGKTIKGKPKKVGPELMFCGEKCFVLHAYKSHPGTSLASMLERMYPLWTIRRGCKNDFLRVRPCRSSWIGLTGEK